jgi:CRISPR-associated endonuclease/helicase Cas3
VTVTRRLSAVKRATVRSEASPKELPEALAEAAWTIAQEAGAPIRCLVFCDRRDDAQKVRDDLEVRCRKAGAGETELLVGGRRVYEREEAARWLEQRGFFAGTRARPERTTFVVATSAGEVGIDLDADPMVSDLVAWERMVQRLGRVNRRGEGDASIVIIPASSDDLEIKARLDAVRAAVALLPRLDDGSIDASPGALSQLKAVAKADRAVDDVLQRASSVAELHPPLHRATVESWSMTTVKEHSGRPEVAPWLRGWVEDEKPQTVVVWRDHLPITDNGRLLTDVDLETYRDAADPHLSECLETETFRVVAWLDQRLNSLKGAGEDGGALERQRVPLRKSDVVGVVLDDMRTPHLIRGNDLSNRDKREELQRRLSGALLLVDTRVGGLQVGLLDPASDAAVDVSSLEGEPRPVPFRVRYVTGAADTDSSHPGWRTEARIAVQQVDEEEVAWLVIESLLREPAESEEGRSVGARRAQVLDEHESWAEESAARIATSLRLPADYTRMLRVAARLHDEGKRAACWQRAFNARLDNVYAKTTTRPNLALLNRYRHELGSLPYAEKDSRFGELIPPLQDLCLHLIAAHHGFARPLLRTDGAEEPPSRLSERAKEVALRFTRLERVWGPWGLAWWEALLRAADQEASRRNDALGSAHG